jgi:hypothetical protein
MNTMKVTDLRLGESLNIVKGKERIVWRKIPNPQGTSMFRRYHYIAFKIHNIMDNKKLGTSEDDELKFRLASGWKRV